MLVAYETIENIYNGFGILCFIFGLVFIYFSFEKRNIKAFLVAVFCAFGFGSIGYIIPYFLLTVVTEDTVVIVEKVVDNENVDCKFYYLYGNCEIEVSEYNSINTKELISQCNSAKNPNGLINNFNTLIINKTNCKLILAEVMYEKEPTNNTDGLKISAEIPENSHFACIVSIDYFYFFLESPPPQSISVRNSSFQRKFWLITNSYYYDL